MPTPVELVTIPVSLFMSYGAFMLREGMLPGRRLPAVAGGRSRSPTAFLFYFFLLPRFPDADGAMGTFTPLPASAHRPVFSTTHRSV
ncbi:MAG TPA: hypothetical protein VGU61_16985 [Noviherbaspirillum sp.]|jgi:hypothetical protein|uniref:hypothetical protein n=1 Tax=Noviherbaspirillum sp. TaxID=1926288 RepID=UPI002DDCF4AC|nr:hypothetical protein [Noviherbaspirillum sp.]HEV2611964.1 hypothetical protein [Noviherbaspirillum sp.]